MRTETLSKFRKGWQAVLKRWETTTQSWRNEMKNTRIGKREDAALPGSHGS